MSNAHEALVDRNKEFTLTSWTAQNAWNPISIAGGEGAYFRDAGGRRYLDWSSQLFNLNLGHGHPAVISAIKEQLDRLQYAMPGLASEPRALLGEKLAEISPHGLKKAFFTTGGSDAIENAMKLARLSTGRQKILTRYRGYHGATFGAMSAGGDPRRLANEPGVPWIVRLPDPYAYRSPLYDGRTQDEGDRAVVAMVEDIIRLEGPENIAAILLEGYSGTSGIIQGGDEYWRGIQALKEKYGLLLIVDEVLSGFGRTGKWFGIDHYPWVKPDLVAIAKGLTAGYIPLGAVMMSETVAAAFDDRVFAGGLTYSGHPVGCAAGAAAVEAYRSEGLVDRARELGVELRAGLIDLAEKHEMIGEVRGAGLHYVIELVRDRETREPLSEFNAPLSAPVKSIAAGLRTAGMSTFVKWNLIFCAPPLVSGPAEIRAGLEMIDKTLAGVHLE
ncbi:MAG TPA: aminotransferase class III-fold pyridoxal phosphate-dependent enzyme [Anaerolineales bacterium]|nr:aminotransferase class III-fold pyridoxal phosphate-dependent enzyme [Anaerolineales bacterium]